MVYAAGNNSYFGLEQADTMATILAYDTPKGPAIGIYENIFNSRALGVYKRFIGDDGAFVISEGKDNQIYRESRVPSKRWQKYIEASYLSNLSDMSEYKEKESGDLGIKETALQISYDIRDMGGISKVYNMTSHTACLYNFVESVRGEETLNYDAIESYKSEV